MLLDIVKLHHMIPTRAVQWFVRLPSTMHRAAELAEQGAPHGTMVGASEQTAGEGRLGRTWHSPADQGLYLTFILRPELPSKDAPLLTMCIGLAVVEALVKHTSLQFDIRWPNDVLVNGRKIAGILVKYEKGAFLAGIGINVLQESFPTDLATPGTSLAMEGCKDFPGEEFIVSLGDLVESYLKMLTEGGKEGILNVFSHQSSYVRGRRVEVDFGGRVEHGTTDGLNEDGYLWLRLPNGERRLVVAGGVRDATE
jgi:BirA family biotin operon repressor/biotin-[acetyl-CoA-carboxylase] ligase